ncbi:DNA adenine methylase [Rhizobium leguminosarum]|uniref:DNA adenine methylase n=1 Tax=Rhizobium leguminosarum TaxID=384 RepID=UPI001C96CAC8|nr:DNA adenine methylase [Rhizobium leguminosarum]MBY5516212.1 hypothetical protein [Rhizobium leguminosarum]
MASFTYMGTKKSLARTISALCEEHEPGPFLDLFSGISAAGASVAPSRQIWCNDAQVFSRTLTEALFLSSDDRPRAEFVAKAVQRFSDKNQNALMKANKNLVDEEHRLLGEGTFEDQILLQARLRDETHGRQVELERGHSHCLFTTRYAGSYLGLVQAIQIDSIRYGTDLALEVGLISSEEHRWAMLAMCRSIARISNSTGHFAQYLTPSRSNIDRVLAKRRHCAWAYWLESLNEMHAIGDAKWRSANRVFHGDAVDVLEGINWDQGRPAIVYADPPYTNDQYSRYYHLFETAILYDYPAANGKGLYREGRFRSSFSLSRDVERSFERMISAAGRSGASLMVSYPSNGLLPHSLQKIPEMMAEHFKIVLDPLIIPHRHSTLGGSKGREKEDVEECIFLATQKPLSIPFRQLE